jgi:hypothetical protein
MHKRGWTYFVIAGHINGEEVSGSGRIPFVYAASKEHSAWLRLKMGSRLTIVDSAGDAIVFDGGGKAVGRYAGGSFFKGLGRPWMGLHTIDTVRRDAAKQQMRFETKYESKSGRAEVVMSGSEGRLTYAIDMEQDVIDKIGLSKTDGAEGGLRFSYLEDVGEAGYEFVEPRVSKSRRTKRHQSPGMLWLLQIVFGEL